MTTVATYREYAAKLRASVIERGGKVEISFNGNRIRYATPKEKLEAAKLFDELADSMEGRNQPSYHPSNLVFRR